MKYLFRIILLLAIVGGAAGGYWYWYAHPKASSNELILFGNVDVRQVDLAVNDNERIAQVLVEEGDFIKQGQLLAKLETERFEYAVQRAEALLEMQGQIVARLEAGSRPEEIRKARADVEAAKADARDRELTLQRIIKLVPTQAATQQDLDNARAAAEAAEARVQALQATLDLAIAGPRKEDIAEAKAIYKRYEAELGQAKHDLSDAYLYAPNNGIIQERILEVGDMASPQKPVYTVALTDPIWGRVYVSEPDLGKIWEGMSATIQTDSFPNKQYEGWVGFISPTAEFTPKPVETSELRTKLVYQVRVFAKNPRNELRLGMPVTVSVQLDQKKLVGNIDSEKPPEPAARNTSPDPPNPAP